jgi:hypothetical protein
MAVLAAAAVAIAACGEGDRADSGTSASSAASPQSSTGRLPAELARNVRQGDRIVGEGRAAFERRLEALRGHPGWSTNGLLVRELPIRVPFFADAAKRYRAEVAFVGLDSQDERGSAGHFLRELPVGFPSIFDPDAEVAAAYGGGQAWPTKIFFERAGEVAHVKIGAYATAELLDEDIERYALGTGG